MKKNKGRKGGKGGDVLTITKEDFKGRKFPTAPSGKYRFRFNKKSSIKPGTNGNILNLISSMTAMHNGKKLDKKLKGVNVFDNIAPHVGWKIAQVLRAMKIKKPPKKMTLQQLLALIKKYDKEIRIVIGRKMYNGKPQNPVLQYLPLDAGKDEEDDDIEDDEDEDSDDEDSDDDDESDDDDDDDDDDDESDDDEDDDSDDDDEDDDDADDDDDDSDDDDEEDEDDDEDDEDEDERPRRGKAKSKKGKKSPKKGKRRR